MIGATFAALAIRMTSAMRRIKGATSAAPPAPRLSYALPQAARRKEAEGTNNQDERDRDKDERLPEWSERFG
jgi:hypothetical protein